MRRSIELGAVVAVVLAACSAPPESQSAGEASVDDEVVQTAYHDFRLVEVVNGLVNPFKITFTPEGDLLVTECCCRSRSRAYPTS